MLKRTELRVRLYQYRQRWGEALAWLAHKDAKFHQAYYDKNTGSGVQDVPLADVMDGVRDREVLK